MDDDGSRLSCSGQHLSSLLGTAYNSPCFEPEPRCDGIFRYRNWLPARRILPRAGGAITYQSERLCRISELPNLWLSFSGYWPERGATLETATFKELEAYAVLSRLPAEQGTVLVVASAGNTAAAFARLCSQYTVPCLIVIPCGGIGRMQFAEALDPCVKIVAIGGNADYYDAIVFAERLARLEGFVPEGGVKNVARRDGLGTTMLHAVETIGHLPDYYFQAIGSGSGGIAVHEAAKRLVGDGRYGRRVPRLMLSQNLPFVPIYRSWRMGQRELVCIDREEGKAQIREIMARVLSNFQPPYSVAGGVFDALTESGGDMLAVGNDEVRQAMALFWDAEGVDLDPAAAVALASLLATARTGRIDRRAHVLVNLTGGGWCRRHRERRVLPIQPCLTIDEQEIRTERSLERALALF
jgi:cysteate synthase